MQHPTLILEAVADYELWFWHAHFDLPGALNDINVLHRSDVFDELSSGQGPEVKFTVNGNEYNMGYYLADGIYPSWATLIKGIHAPVGLKHKHFTMMQSAYRKDVERAFGVLQAWYHIVKQSSRLWSHAILCNIMKCCIILHNMTIEDERGQALPQDYEGATHPTYLQGRAAQLIADLIARYRQIRSKETHSSLLDDLVEHVWQHVPQREW